MEGRIRVVIKNVKPEIEEGQYPIKRVVGEKVTVQADIFADGHDRIAAVLLYRKASEKKWREAPLRELGNDRWEGEFVVEEMCAYYYTLQGWVDHFQTWQKDLDKKIKAGQDIKVDLLIGAEHIEEAVKRASKADAKKLKEFAGLLRTEKDGSKAASLALSPELTRLMEASPDKTFAVTYCRELEVAVDRGKALFSSWYEIFPRSCSPEAGRSGTLKDCERLLPEMAAMGFNVLYLSPIHPIGKTSRKGKDNVPAAREKDPGSPWAIGSEEGGHKSIDPSLGSMRDFESLMEAAGKHDIEIAMDLAFHCSPDHPYVKEHPKWFRKRPDGTIQYAENPPKKYEDVVPFNFETEEWEQLWQEMKSITLFWIEKGVRIFRVDNPHTKPFVFWEWFIKEIKRDYPEVIFLSEAFTRPKVMYRLAEVGFSQSYTYFTWRNTKKELTDYLTALTRTDIRDYFRPNFWTNTPDILPEYLQYNGRAAFIIRLILAATLSSNYGVFGPAFELCVREALPGREEYKNSEKYEIKYWDRNSPGNLKGLMAKINKIRKENQALHTPWNLKFCEVDNDSLLVYAKASDDLSNILLVAVNLDPFHTQSGWLKVPINELGIDPGQSYLVHDLIGDAKYIWQGERNYVELNPSIVPAHILRVHKRVRRESDFDYYM